MLAEYEITTPDGAVYRVEGPDGLSESQIEEFAQRYLARERAGERFSRPQFRGPNPGRAAAPVSTPGWMDSLMSEPDLSTVPGYIHGLARSTVNQVAGAATGLAALPDIGARGVAALLGGASDLVGLPDWVTQSLSDPITIGGEIQDAVPMPTDAMSRYARTGMEGVGGAVSGVGAGGLLSRAASPVMQRVGALLGVAPGQQVAAGATGALAAQGAQDIGAPVPVQIATGIVAGGLTPAALRGTAGAVDGMVDRLTVPGVDREAARYIRSNITGSEDDVLRNIDAGGPTRSGATPTLAEVSLDPGLASMQRGVGNLSGRIGGRISERVAANNNLRLDTVDNALGTGNPRDIELAAQARQRALEAETGAAVEGVGPLLPPDEAGAVARNHIVDAYQEARARTANAYDNPILLEDPPVQLRPIEAVDITVPTVGDVRPMQAFQEQAVRGARAALPPRPQTLLEWVRARGGVAADGMGADDLRSSGMGARGQPTLVREGGVPLDRLREEAVEAGFVDEGTDLADFTSLLADEYAGVGAAARTRIADSADVANYDEAVQARQFWRQQFDERDLDPTRMTNDDWTRFYNDVAQVSDQPRTLGDMDMEPQPGRLMGPFQQALSAIRQRYFGDGGTEAPAAIRNFLSDVIDADQVGLRTLEGWERRAYDLASGAPDRTTAAALKAVGRAIGGRAATEGGSERRAALEAARAARREQGEVFEEGQVGRVAARGDYGRFDMPESNVGRALVPPGRTGGEVADQVVQAAGSNAEGIARAELRRALDAAGENPRRIAKVATDYREAMSRFPGIENDVRTARQNAAMLGRFRQTQLGRFAEGASEPSQAVSRLLTVQDGGRAFRELVNGPGLNPSAAAGIRRSVAEHIRSSSRSSTIDQNLRSEPITRKVAEGIVQTLQRTQGTPLLTSGQRATLNAVRRELRADQFARSANRPSGSDTARNAGYAFKLLEGAMEVVPAAGGIRNMTQFLFRHLAKTDDILAVVANAIEDPRIAAELLRKPTPQRIERVLDGARAYIQASTLGSAASANEVDANAQ